MSEVRFRTLLGAFMRAKGDPAAPEIREVVGADPLPWRGNGILDLRHVGMTK